jgi:GMP synthase (glutamine-hydrolysing)
MNVKILLLQARESHDAARDNERRSFALRAGIGEANILPYDLLTGTPTLREVRQYDALMVGGSGEYYVSKRNLPGFPAVMELLREVTAVGHPTFASCFGFQLMVEALGGRIVYDEATMEVGTYELSLTEAGQFDDLFGVLPNRFQAQLGHKDRADSLPEGTINLASSASSVYQALRVPDKPVWATQFHPELTGNENLKRFKRYLDGYAATMSQEELDETLNRFIESPETEKLMPRFLDLVFG